MPGELPLLYSFRRCPYAMRARMSLFVSGQTCELREIVLRDKPTEMIELSPKATVPLLLLTDGTVIEQSLDIMVWALNKNDPEDWCQPEVGTFEEMLALIEEADGDFKENLDRYKYAPRYENVDPIEHRTKAEEFLSKLEGLLLNQSYLFGGRAALADYGIAPFIRQFANTDRVWFDAAPYPNLQDWLERILTTAPFIDVMEKYPIWSPGDEPTLFAA